jgi:phosphopantothenoylcysteine decarboxylase/phosphopantothenate--cysteine ligase
MKKSDQILQWRLEKTRDIAKTLGHQKKDGQLMIGFALETNDELAHAQKKLVSKNLDMVILNSLQDKGAGFGHDTNKVTVLYKDGSITPFELKSKEQTAWDILSIVEKKWESLT